MGKSPRQRVLGSFSDSESLASAKDYSDKVYAAWTDSSSSLRRNVVLMLLLAGIFELLVYQKQSSIVTIVSVSFANVPTVQIVLPTIVAFLFYEGQVQSARWLDFESVYRTLMEKLGPKMASNDLDHLIRPSLPLFWAVGGRLDDENALRSDKFTYAVTASISVISYYVFSLGFESQAFYRLVAKFGYYNIFLWLNAGIVATLLVCAYVYVRMRRGVYYSNQ